MPMCRYMFIHIYVLCVQSSSIMYSYPPLCYFSYLFMSGLTLWCLSQRCDRTFYWLEDTGNMSWSEIKSRTSLCFSFLAFILQLCVSAAAPAFGSVEPENHGNKTKQSSLQWTIAYKFSLLFPSSLSSTKDSQESKRAWQAKCSKYKCAWR